MKKTILLIVILFCFSWAFSQESVEKNRCSIGLKFLGGQFWASGTMDQYLGIPGKDIEIKSVFSQAFGANFIYQSGKNMAIESGLYYSFPGFKSERERYIMYTGDSTHFGLLQAYRTVFVDFQNLYVPVKFRYTWPLQKFSLFASGGPAVNFILNAEQRIRVEEEEGELIDESTGEPHSTHTAFFSLNVSVGLDYRFSKSLIFSFEPEYHLGFTNLFKEVEWYGLPASQPEQKLRTAGVSLGIRYMINK